MDPLEPVLSKLLIALVIVSAIVNMVSYKKRWLAQHFLKLECLTRIVAIMIPNASGYAHRADQLHVFAFGVVFGTLFCGQGSDIIITSLTLLFHQTVGSEVNYGKSNFDQTQILSILILVTSFFLATYSVGLLIVYIKETNRKLHNSNESNI